MPRVRTVARLIALLALASCGDGYITGSVVPAAIIITPNYPSLGQGLDLQLTATVVDVRGREILGLRPTFTSGNLTIATVTPSGLVTSVGPVATVAITAAYQGISNSVSLVVTQRALSLSITPNPLVVHRNTEAHLSIATLDFLGNPVVAQIGLTSLDPSVATVTPSGAVIAGGNAGTTQIVVTAAGLSDTVPVTVIIVPTTIEVQPTSIILPLGGSRQVAVTVKDLLGGVIGGATASFTTTAPAVFDVSPEGLITSLGSNGSGTVRVTYTTLVTVVGVFVGSARGGAVTATTPVTGGPYAAAIGSAGQMVVSRTAVASAVLGTLPEVTFPASVATVRAPLGVAINPAGTRAYVGAERAITVIDLATNTALPPILGFNEQVFDVRFSPDGRVIYAGANQQVYRVDVASQVPLDSTPARTATWLIVHPTLPRVYATYLDVAAVVELDATTLQELRRFNVGGVPQGLALGPGAAELFVAVEGPAKLDVWDLATGVRIQEAALAHRGFGVVVLGDFIVVTEALDGTVEFLDLASRVSLARLLVGGSPRRLAVNDGGTILVVPNASGWVDFIE